VALTTVRGAPREHFCHVQQESSLSRPVPAKKQAHRVDVEVTREIGQAGADIRSLTVNFYIVNNQSCSRNAVSPRNSRVQKHCERASSVFSSNACESPPPLSRRRPNDNPRLPSSVQAVSAGLVQGASPRASKMPVSTEIGLIVPSRMRARISSAFIFLRFSATGNSRKRVLKSPNHMVNIQLVRRCFLPAARRGPIETRNVRTVGGQLAIQGSHC
jgi:hypothetical protein